MENQMNPTIGEAGKGMLPSPAPLAYPFVAFQNENPEKYAAKKGIVRGTLFPGLDLPFMGMVNKSELSDTPLHELQALSFAISELGLYLDTHPEDQEALSLFRQYVQLYEQGVQQYQKLYGPLTITASGQGSGFDWVKGPWPWDIDANKEG